MRAVTWLHISDFHLRESEKWSQNAVLSAMLGDIKHRCDNGLAVDFILATGDLTFSGEQCEYDLVAAFLRDLAALTTLSPDMIFCVPGNHDIQRDRYKMCFAGARQELQSENDVYAFLTDTEERMTLLRRQENFSIFQQQFFAEQKREATIDNLGYVCSFDVDDFRIAIMGLNSAWLSEGGSGDERQLLLGENQVNNAIDIANSTAPHIIIGIQHHPFDFLKRFDQRATQRRLEEACHFIHYGHLHESNTNQVATQSRQCLSLVAGASFESRRFRNAYTVVTLDPLHAETDVTFVQYEPSSGAFSYVLHRCYEHEIDAATVCTIAELSEAIEFYCPVASQMSHYLASLLLGYMTDVPVRTRDAVVFGTPELLKNDGDGELEEVTKRFLAVGRAIKLLYGQKSLSVILSEHGKPIASYSVRLGTLCETSGDLREQLFMRNTDAASLAGADDAKPFGYSLNLLNDLLAEGDWEGLREFAERCCKINEGNVSATAKRTLALCLARSSEEIDRQRATALYRELTASAYVVADDWAALATILTDVGNHEDAKIVLKEGIEQFPQKIDGFVVVGMKIVEATKDLAFRDELRRICSEEKTE